MQQIRKLSAIFLLLPLVLGGCTGTKIRSDVLLPRMQDAWPSLRADAERTEVDPVVLDEFELRLNQGASLAVFSQWPAVHARVLEGIQGRVDNGEIGEGVAVSLRERVRQFDAAVTALGRRFQ